MPRGKGSPKRQKRDRKKLAHEGALYPLRYDELVDLDFMLADSMTKEALVTGESRAEAHPDG